MRIHFLAFLLTSALTAQTPAPPVKPLTELGQGTYKGETGGLYPGGANTPPAAHRKAGMTAAAAIVPRDGGGKPSGDGKIVLLSIGMSNTTQEFQAFQKLAAAAALNPRLAIVDGAQGGQTAAITGNPQARFWQVVDERLEKAGVAGAQVQVVWLKQANARPAEPFPAEARKLEADLVQTIDNLRARFANLKIIYLSSRTYGGFAATPLNPEPHAFETGFAVKWTIERQIAGQLPASPWLAWGPYLWADGGRWTRADFAQDGTHPSDAGRAKVARLLLDFLSSEPTAKGWFLKN